MRDSWKPWQLGEAGEEMKLRNTEFVTYLEAMGTQIRDAGTHWSGDAYWSAYDRIAGDRDVGKSVSNEIGDLATALVTAGSDLTSYRQVVLDKVFAATEAGLTVSDDWKVTAAEGSSGGDEDAFTHQTAITTALNQLLDIQTQSETAIQTAASEVQTQGERIGTGDPIDETTSDDSQSLLQGQPKSTVATEEQPTETTQQNTVPAATQVSQTGEQTGEQSKQTGEQSKQTGEQTGEQSKQTGEQSKQTGEQSKQTGEQTGEQTEPAEETTANTDKGTAGVWRPGDISDLVSAASKITGTVPNLITSLTGLDDDLDDIIKAGGEAVKSGADGITSVVSAVDKAVDSVPGATPVDQTAAGDPSAAKPAGDPSAEKPAGDPSAEKPAGEQPAQKPQTGEQSAEKPPTGDQPTQKPHTGEQSAEKPPTGDQPAAKPAEGTQASSVTAPTDTPPTGPQLSTISNPGTPNGGLMGAMPAPQRSESDSEHTRTVDVSAAQISETQEA
ncbi:hypothetical protein [Nocardia altamirensis]|uniref:hypothetical protein n=1 Tax=Nocardia altamirensis TaxID=472158 RepID=UPI00114D1282|nr:hypothetical protein [Nocardia altamirensis]